MAETMTVWQQATPGLIEEKLKLVDNIRIPKEALKKGEILIRVMSAGLNPADYKVMEMGYVSRATTKFPKVAGMDLSGTVVAVAAGSTDIIVGDNILGRVEPSKSYGSLSQYVVLPRDGYAVQPKSVDLDHVAGVPTAGITAYRSIKPYVKAGDRIFINSGSGGTDTFGIQIAKAIGCHLTTSCSSTKVDLVRKLGADAVTDYRMDDIVTKLKPEGQVYDLVVDSVENSPKAFLPPRLIFSKPGVTILRLEALHRYRQLKKICQGSADADITWWYPAQVRAVLHKECA
ncbi:hypothetical protein NUH16_010035 [Penicillium rubens]|nr:hypothetical protein LCP963914a_9854 [Penicillium roqueforti]KAJ5046992.1 hypothetical protein NUH16_010035 [Penicillium rubens]